MFLILALIMHPVTVPPPMPRDVCVEIMWELIHSPQISSAERDHVIHNLRQICPPLPRQQDFPPREMQLVMDTL